MHLFKAKFGINLPSEVRVTTGRCDQEEPRWEDFCHQRRIRDNKKAFAAHY